MIERVVMLEISCDHSGIMQFTSGPIGKFCVYICTGLFSSSVRQVK
jgi:hypothetical protein